MLAQPFVQLFFRWLAPQLFPETLVKILMFRLEYFFKFGATLTPSSFSWFSELIDFDFRGVQRCDDCQLRVFARQYQPPLLAPLKKADVFELTENGEEFHLQQLVRCRIIAEQHSLCQL